LNQKTDILTTIGTGFFTSLSAAVQGNAYYRSEEGIVRFVREVLRPDKIHDYQAEILQAFVRERRVAVRGPHGLGKSALASWCVLWGMSVFPADWDVKVITTASAWRQVERYLWPEIHKWVYKADFTKVGLQMRKGQELLQLSIRLPNKEAFAAVSDRPELMEGAHARVIIFIFDEAKTIPDGFWDAMEGAFSQEGLKDHFVFILAISTPGDSQGRFYDIHTKKPGLGDWWVRHVTLDEAVDAGQISPSWADNRKKQWGANSPLYQRRVLGNFYSSNDSMIPLDWVEASSAKWLDWQDGKKQEKDSPVALGCDPGGSGAEADETGIVEFKDYVVTAIEELIGLDTTEISDMLMDKDRKKNKMITIDSIGLGAGVVDTMRRAEHTVIGVNVSEATNWTDVSGEIRFINLRSCLWWMLREFLDPDMPRGVNILIPPHDKLTAELIVPRWEASNRGLIQVESKVQIRKRLGGKSTNLADGLLLAMYGSLVGSSHGIWL
jgi:hypothetical protein